MASTKSAKLAIVIAGENKSAVRALKGTGDEVDRLGKKTKSARSGLSNVLGGLAIGAGASYAFAEAEEAQKTERQTAAVIKATGNAAEVSSAQQGQLVDKYSKLAAVDDEVVAGGANMIRTFRAIKGENFEETLKQSLNYTAFKGGDLASNAELLGKALNNPTKGYARLMKAGVDFDASQIESIKTMQKAGDTAGAQKIILQELEKEYGGQAEAAVTGAARTRVALANTAEAVGTALLPAAEVVGDLGERFAGLPDYVQKGAAGLLVGAFAATKLAEPLGRVDSILGSGIERLTGFTAATTTAAAAEVAATTATEGAVAARKAATVAQTQSTAAQAALAGAMTAGTGIEAAAITAEQAHQAETLALTAATLAETEAEIANAAATEAAAVASTKVGVSAGGAVAGIGLLAAAAYGLHEAFDGKDGKLTLPGLDELLGGTDEALAEMATGLDSVGDSADNFNQVAAELGTEGLYAMRDAVKATGGKAIPELEKAIKSAEAAEARAAERKKGYAAAADLVTGKTDESAAAIKGEAAALTPLAIALGTVAAAQVQARKETLDRIAKAEKIHDAEKGATDAHEATTEALDAQSVAHRAAIGDSDAYRSAVEGEASAEKDLADTRNSVVEARQAVRDAEADVNKTRAEAVDRINELARAEEDAANKAKDAITGRLDAEAEQRRVNSSGKSTDLDKRKAADAVRDASTEERQSAEEAALAARDATDAKARGVDGDEAVVAARKKVTDANGAVADAEDKVRDAVGKVAASHEAARQVIVDAKAAEKAATDAVRDAQYQEVDAVAALATARQGDVAGIFAKIAALQALGADPVYQQELADAIGAGAPAPVPVSGGFGFGGITVNQTLNGTPRQNAQANARGTRSVLDGIARVFR